MSQRNGNYQYPKKEQNCEEERRRSPQRLNYPIPNPNRRENIVRTYTNSSRRNIERSNNSSYVPRTDYGYESRRSPPRQTVIGHRNRSPPSRERQQRRYYDWALQERDESRIRYVRESSPSRHYRHGYSPDGRSPPRFQDRNPSDPYEPIERQSNRYDPYREYAETGRYENSEPSYRQLNHTKEYMSPTRRSTSRPKRRIEVQDDRDFKKRDERPSPQKPTSSRQPISHPERRALNYLKKPTAIKNEPKPAKVSTPKEKKTLEKKKLPWKEANNENSNVYFPTTHQSGYLYKLDDDNRIPPMGHRTRYNPSKKIQESEYILVEAFSEQVTALLRDPTKANDTTPIIAVVRTENQHRIGTNFTTKEASWKDTKPSEQRAIYESNRPSKILTTFQNWTRLSNPLACINTENYTRPVYLQHDELALVIRSTVTTEDTRKRYEVEIVSETYPNGIVIPMSKLSYEFSEELYPNSLVKLVMTTPSLGNYYGETYEGLKIFIIPEVYGRHIPPSLLSSIIQITEDTDGEKAVHVLNTLEPVDNETIQGLSRSLETHLPIEGRKAHLLLMILYLCEENTRQELQRDKKWKFLLRTTLYMIRNGDTPSITMHYLNKNWIRSRDDIYRNMVKVVNSIPLDIYGEANDESVKLMREIFINKPTNTWLVVHKEQIAGIVALITYIAKQSHGNIVIISNEGDPARDVFDELVKTMNLRTEEEIQETIYFDLREQLGTDEEELEMLQLEKKIVILSQSNAKRMIKQNQYHFLIILQAEQMLKSDIIMLQFMFQPEHGVYLIEDVDTIENLKKSTVKQRGHMSDNAAVEAEIAMKLNSTLRIEYVKRNTVKEISINIETKKMATWNKGIHATQKGNSNSSQPTWILDKLTLEDQPKTRLEGILSSQKQLEKAANKQDSDITMKEASNEYEFDRIGDPPTEEEQELAKRRKRIQSSRVLPPNQMEINQALEDLTDSDTDEGLITKVPEVQTTSSEQKKHSSSTEEHLILVEEITEMEPTQRKRRLTPVRAPIRRRSTESLQNVEVEQTCSMTSSTATSRDPAAETKAGCQRTPETKGGRSNITENQNGKKGRIPKKIRDEMKKKK
uniref:Uncharacterized protein n=1 Tax=Acrobeloides nanus TaxID=290746 RepID=A0A914DKQ8_9BILA